MPVARQQDRPATYELWPEHWAAWQVFLACATQWRVLVGLGGMRYQGLDYGAVQAVMRLHGIKRRERREVFGQLQVLEDEALRVINASAEASR